MQWGLQRVAVLSGAAETLDEASSDSDGDDDFSQRPV
jgi:hypothetical protein